MRARAPSLFGVASSGWVGTCARVAGRDDAVVRTGYRVVPENG